MGVFVCVFVQVCLSIKGEGWEGEWWRSLWSTPGCEAHSVWAPKVMGDTCFPSHLPTSSWDSGSDGGESQPPPQRSTKPPVFLSCLVKEEEVYLKKAKADIQCGNIKSEVKVRCKKPKEKMNQSALKPCLNVKLWKLCTNLNLWAKELR